MSALPKKLRNRLLGETSNATKFSEIQKFVSFITQYWRSNQWKQAWGMTAAIGALIYVSSKSNVWMAENIGRFTDALLNLPSMQTDDAYMSLAQPVALVTAVMAAQHFVLHPAKDGLMQTLHRFWQQYLNDDFNNSIVRNGNAYHHLSEMGGKVMPDGFTMPKNIDQAWEDSTKAMSGHMLGLAHGLASVTTTAYLIAKALTEKTGTIEGLEFMGENAPLYLAFGIAAAYVPINTVVAFKLGKYLERVTKRVIEAEAAYRSELNGLMSLSFHIAASGASKIQAKVNDKLYGELNYSWAKKITANTLYSGYSGFYHAFASRLLMYIPFVPLYKQGHISFGTMVANSELFNSFIRESSWFITVMPAISSVKAHYRRVTDVKEAVQRVSDPQAFYRNFGVSNYTYHTQDPAFGLRVRHLKLMHEGHDAVPFLEAQNLRFRPGQWVSIEGDSGCGKTTFFKALNKLWPYGEGVTIMPEGARVCYVSQDTRLPQTLTLKELVSLPDDEHLYSDEGVRAVLHDVGLGQFSAHIHDTRCINKPWQETLSGGQKKNLVLARLLLHKFDVIFLDESYVGLDPEAKQRYLELLKACNERAIVISIMHDKEIPLQKNGKPFFDIYLRAENGYIQQKSAKSYAPGKQYSPGSGYSIPYSRVPMEPVFK